MTRQRAALLIVAVVAGAWLAISYRDARLIRNAQVAAADPHATPARIEAALRDARRSGTLDPSRTEGLSYAAVLEIRLRRLVTARRLLEEVVRREPEAAEPYLLIAGLTRKTDPARSAAARARLNHLDPLGARPPK